MEGGSVSSVEAAVSVLCPRATTMCDGYAAIPPAVMVNQPVTNAVYNTPFVTASFEFANFQVPRDGALHVTVGGRILQVRRRDPGLCWPGVYVVPMYRCDLSGSRAFDEAGCSPTSRGRRIYF